MQAGLVVRQDFLVVSAIKVAVLSRPWKIEIILADNVLRRAQPRNAGEGLVTTEIPAIKVLPEDCLEI